MYVKILDLHCRWTSFYFPTPLGLKDGGIDVRKLPSLTKVLVSNLITLVDFLHWHTSRARWWNGHYHCQPNPGPRSDAPPYIAMNIHITFLFHHETSKLKYLRVW